MIENRQYRIRKSELTGFQNLPETVGGVAGKTVLRWYVSQVTKDEIVLEATTYGEQFDEPLSPVVPRYNPGKSAVLSLIPTGIGCSIGGFAGDAAPVTNLLASTVDYLITNPNSVNASNFIGLDSDNIVYTDGCSLDFFAQGLADLYLPYSNKVGLIVEKSDERTLDIVFNIVNVARAVHGINITDVVVTEKSIGGRCIENKSGAFVGTIDNPQVLFESCDKLIRNGVNAIAITSSIQELPLDAYVKHFAGEYPNPVGGVEAVISYLTTTRFRVPSAHAPILNLDQLDLRNNIVDARGAGEHASPSGLACILIGLQRAPQISPRTNVRVADILHWNNILAVVTPASCLGGIPVIYALRHGIPVIAVEENRTILDVSKSKCELPEIIEARNYTEAAGIILALKKGLNLESIARPLNTLRY
ncbi:MAG TPA: DUF3326 domain-containing protein [Pyrinomonadaceae bacterium]|jgi:hypothetical protein